MGEKPLSTEERLREAWIQEAPKVKEQYDMAIISEIVRIGYEEMVKNDPSRIPSKLPSVECNACLQKKSLIMMHKCGRCMRIFYCNTECQRKDWPVHKQMCK